MARRRFTALDHDGATAVETTPGGDGVLGPAEYAEAVQTIASARTA
jgi:hypothetical protein